MPNYNYSHPITVRYSDLDPQGHVNNARYLSYFEQARVAYIKHLQLWDGKSFLDFGVVLANAKVDFKIPILMSDDVKVKVCISRLGTKSLEMEYEITDKAETKTFATGSTTMVAYDYHKECTIPIPEAWREKIVEFERIL